MTTARSYRFGDKRVSTSMILNFPFAICHFVIAGKRS